MYGKSKLVKLGVDYKEIWVISVGTLAGRVLGQRWRLGGVAGSSLSENAGMADPPGRRELATFQLRYLSHQRGSGAVPAVIAYEVAVVDVGEAKN